MACRFDAIGWAAGIREVIRRAEGEADADPAVPGRRRIVVVGAASLEDGQPVTAADRPPRAGWRG